MHTAASTAIMIHDTNSTSNDCGEFTDIFPWRRADVSQSTPGLVPAVSSFIDIKNRFVHIRNV